MTTSQLLGLSMIPVIRFVKKFLLQRKLKALYRLADYFSWQSSNGMIGLQDTHKRIVIAESDLRNLK